MWRVLVVDDNLANRELILELLADQAHCSVAVNGQEALEAYDQSLKSKPYDIILLDISMPDIDGVEVLERIREREEKAGVALGKGIPIVMVTAHKEPVMTAFNKGCDNYILKPVIKEDLIAKIEEKIGKSQ